MAQLLTVLGNIITVFPCQSIQIVLNNAFQVLSWSASIPLEVCWYRTHGLLGEFVVIFVVRYGYNCL